MAPPPDEEVSWQAANYFNYYTEIEEHFQRARGTALFLLSPLDWALLEAWKNAGVPLEAVLRGIDVAFEKWRAKKNRIQQVNSVAYCAQAVLLEAQAMAAGKKNATRLGAHIVFVDESGFMMIPPVRRTWAPIGETPILRHYYRRDRISVIGGLLASMVLSLIVTPAVHYYLSGKDR